MLGGLQGRTAKPMTPGTAILAASCVVLGAHGTGHPSAMSRVRDSFRRASIPRLADLPGVWVLTRHVSTERFLTGGTGPDHALFDANGIRRTIDARARFEWTLEFQRTADGHLRAISHTVWFPTDDASDVVFRENRDLVFQKDYGGDRAWVYRCRALAPDHLVCLLDGSDTGHGVEFTKAAQQGPDGPAPR